MCGIAGYFAPAGIVDPGKFTATLNRMGVALESRGPDAVGTWTRDGVFYTKELCAIEAVAGGLSTIERSSVAIYLKHNGIASPHSIYRQISKLPPGSSLCRNFDARTTVKRYWKAEEKAAAGLQNTLYPGFEERKERLKQEFVRSAVEQETADVPVGVFLSGGVDSALIAAILQREGSRETKGFTLGFDDPAHDEAPRAARPLVRSTIPP